MGRGDYCVTRGVDSREKTLHTTSVMNANSHRVAKRGEKLQLRRRNWQLVPLEGGKFYGERLVEDIASSSSFSRVSFLGCSQKSFILFIQNNLLKRTMALWSSKKKENCACLCLSPQLISSKYGVMFNKPLQRKIRTSTQTQLHQYLISIQLGEKVQLIVKTLELWSRHESVT